MKPTKTEEEQVGKWFKEVFWPAYPSSFCRSGKGSRAKAMVSMLKYNPDKAEQERIIGNLKAQVRADKANPDRIYWSIGLTYVNNRMWDDEIESAMEVKEKEALKICSRDNCNDSVHGPRFTECALHIPSVNDKRYIKLCEARKNLSAFGPDRNDSDFAKKCREYSIKQGFIIG